MDKVSIITPTYNSAAYICHTIDSIRSQSYKNWELLITDDNSTDNTWSILEHYSNIDSRVKIFRFAQNRGPAKSRNNSISHAVGRYIAFCDSDDLWEPSKLEEQITFQKDYNYDITYSYYTIIDKNGKEIGAVKSPSKINYSLMLLNDFIGFLTVIYDTNKFGKVYLPNILKRQDWALLLILFKNKASSGCYKKHLAKYRLHEKSISNNKMSLVKYIFEVYYSIMKIGCVASVLLLLQYPPVYFMKRIVYHQYK